MKGMKGYKRRLWIVCLIVALVTGFLADTGIGVQAAEGMAQNGTAQEFVHPGILHTQKSIEAMKKNLAGQEEPTRSAYEQLKNDGFSDPDWKGRPLEAVVRGGTGDNRAQMFIDIQRAYQTALLWKMGAGDQYGDAAVRILNGWSHTMKSLSGNADRFLCGIYGYQMANAAELVRDHKDFDLPAMKTLLTEVFYPLNHQFLVEHNNASVENYWANWDLANLASMIAIGVFADRRDLYEEAVSYYKNGEGMGSVLNAMPYEYAAGNYGEEFAQWQELHRDQGHTMLGIGLCGAINEIAWNQGDNLYGLFDNRFLKAVECVVRYNNLSQDNIPFSSYTRYNSANGKWETGDAPSGASRGQIRGVYTLVYNHYVNRMGLAAPELKKWLYPQTGGPRVEGVTSRNGDEPGFQSLTFHNVSTRDEGKQMTAVQGALEDGVYLFRNYANDTVLADQNGTLTCIDKNSDEAQWWQVVNTLDGGYLIRNQKTGRILQLESDDFSSGSAAYQAKTGFQLVSSENGSKNQKFAILAGTSDVTYRIAASVSSLVMMQDTDGRICQEKYSGRNTAQEWIVERKEKQRTEIAYFNFDDQKNGLRGAGAVCNVNGALSFVEDPQRGRVVSLDQDAWLTVTKEDGSPLLSGCKELTVSFYSKMDRTDTNWAFYAAPNASVQTYPKENYIGIFEKGQSLNAERYHGGRNAQGSAAVSGETGQGWNHIVVVYEKEKVRLYINGVCVAEKAAGCSLEQILGEESIVQIGKANWGKGEFFRGKLDDFTICNYAMDENEVLSLEERKLAAHFSFDDPSGGFEDREAKAVGKTAPVLSEDAHAGKSLYLDGSGNNYLSILKKNGEPLLTGWNEMTISYWSKVNNTKTNWLFYAAPDENAQNVNREVYLGARELNGFFLFERYKNNGKRAAILNGKADKNVWKHITLAIEKDRTRLYINGQRVTELDSRFTMEEILGNNSVFYIGKANWGSKGEYCNAWIDDVCIYNYALSDGQAEKAYEGYRVTQDSQMVYGSIKANEGVQQAPEMEAQAGYVHVYADTPGDVRSEKYTMTANDTQIPVIRYQANGNNFDIARFSSADATPEYTVTLKTETIDTITVYPERYYEKDQLKISEDRHSVTFTMSENLRYAFVMINGSVADQAGKPYLAIINDPPEEEQNIPDPDAKNVLNAKEFMENYLKEHPNSAVQKAQPAGITSGGVSYEAGMLVENESSQVRFPNTRKMLENDMTYALQAALDEIYKEGSAYDTLYFPAGTYIWSGLEMKNRKGKKVTIYVEEGALLKNRLQECMQAMEPAIGIWDCEDITIAGRGIFDGNGVANYKKDRHDAKDSCHQGGVMIVRSSNITFLDTYVRDAKQWNWESHGSENCTLKNIKGLTPYNQPWVDGLDMASAKNLTIDGAITLGNDDNFASGHYNPSDGFTNTVPGFDQYNSDCLLWDTKDSEQIRVSNTLGWSFGGGNGVRLGHNTYGHKLKSYYLTNVNTTNFTGGGNGITVQNGTGNGHPYPYYEELVFEDCSFDTTRVKTNINIHGLDTDNRIGKVMLNNCWFSGAENGSTIEHVNELHISDWYAGKPIKRESQAKLTTEDIVYADYDWMKEKADSFYPDEIWKDTAGNVIQAHGGGVLWDEKTQKYYWYGENKGEEKTASGGIVAIGVSCYSSEDLYNWTYEGMALPVFNNPAFLKGGNASDDTPLYLPESSAEYQEAKQAKKAVSEYDTLEKYNTPKQIEALNALYEGMNVTQKQALYEKLNWNCVMERPKVLYNAKNDNYVMWFHKDGEGIGNYELAQTGIAVSESPAGPFRLIDTIRPNGMESRDMTLFQDDDGTAYLIHSSEDNWTLYIAQLNEDYTGLTGAYSRNYVDKSGSKGVYAREAPAIFKADGKYYLISSGCTGWRPNQMGYSVTDDIRKGLSKTGEKGPFQMDTLSNPCVGTDAQLSFGGQSTYVLQVQGKQDCFIYMGDKWNSTNLKDSRYQWLPIRIDKEKQKLTIAWSEEWSLEDLELANSREWIELDREAFAARELAPDTYDFGQKRWKNLQELLKKADSLDYGTDAKDVETLTAEIQKAVQQLKKWLLLDAAFSEAENRTDVEYTKESWKALKDVCDEARELEKQQEDDVTQEQITIASDKIKQAVQKLVRVEVEEEALDLSNAEVSTDSFQTGNEAKKAIDGDSTTIWHNAWTGTVKPFPHHLTVDLGEETEDLYRLSYLPRQDKDSNGIVTGYRILVSNADKELTALEENDFEEVRSGSWAEDKTEKTVVFRTEGKVRFVRLEILSGAGGYASAAELKLFRGVITKTEAGNEEPGENGKEETLDSGTKEEKQADTTEKEMPKKITGLSIEAESVKIACTKRVKLQPVILPKDASDKTIQWSCDRPDYASVLPDGTVITKKAGRGKSVTITAKAADGSGQTAKIRIKIMKHAVKKIMVRNVPKSLKAGKSIVLKATVQTSGKNANKKLKWESSDSEYATVSAKGKVSAKKAGKGKTVKITVRSMDGTGKKKTVKIRIR
ncbi:MAG: hypothetical protein E7294_08990 [Lachnospiraceae bacterium]|nr:hypothetical protein [Lachnospiraceae bacterium]